MQGELALLREENARLREAAKASAANAVIAEADELNDQALTAAPAHAPLLMGAPLPLQEASKLRGTVQRLKAELADARREAAKTSKVISASKRVSPSWARG